MSISGIASDFLKSAYFGLRAFWQLEDEPFQFLYVGYIIYGR